MAGECRKDGLQKDGLQNLNRQERETAQRWTEGVGRSWLEGGSVSTTWLVKAKGLGWPIK
jgi:hypothetical protein